MSAPYTIAWNTLPVANGPHTLTAVARDAAGNSRTAVGVAVTVANPDITPPAVAITSPVAGATVSGSLTVSATASDGVGVVGVQFRLDGAALGAEDTSTPYSVVWNTLTAANGAHTLTAVARDAAGNTTASAGVTVTVANDTTPPAVAISAPLAAATVSGSITITATASDNVAVVGVQFRVDGAALGAEDTTAPYSIAWNTTAASNGTHTLTAVARDAAGNRTTSAAATVDVENSAAPPTNVLFGTQTIGPTADQNVAGLAEAFRTISTTAGTVRMLRVYVATGSAATAVTVGLYTDNAGHPGTLLTQGTLNTPAANAWNDLPVPAASAPAGTYWVALLSPAGQGVVKFRDVAGGGAAETSSVGTLGTLPATWSTGARYTDGQLSGYALGTIP